MKLWRGTLGLTNTSHHLCCLQVQVQCEVEFLKDAVRGDPTTEMRIKLVAFLDDEVPPADD